MTFQVSHLPQLSGSDQMKKILSVFFLLNINFLYSDSALNPDYFFISLGDKNDSHPNKFNTYVSCNRGGDDIEFEDGSLPTCQNQDNSSLSIGIGYDLNETTSFEFSYYDLGNSESYLSTEEFYCDPYCGLLVVVFIMIILHFRQTQSTISN